MTQWTGSFTEDSDASVVLFTLMQTYVSPADPTNTSCVV